LLFFYIHIKKMICRESVSLPEMEDTKTVDRFRGEKPRVNPEKLIEIVSDRKSMRILSVTAEEGLTVKEISESCGLPKSTVYRKVESLTEAGLLEERLRRESTGHHSKEYGLRSDEISVSTEVGDFAEVEISVDVKAAAKQKRDTERKLSVSVPEPDGGR
jgi:DNA-binding transcriptional ArsR family regulator